MHVSVCGVVNILPGFRGQTYLSYTLHLPSSIPFGTAASYTKLSGQSLEEFKSYLLNLKHPLVCVPMFNVSSYSCMCHAGCMAGCGIRLEDNVLVTEDGRDVLNHSCPQSPWQLTTLSSMIHCHNIIVCIKH